MFWGKYTPLLLQWSTDLAFVVTAQKQHFVRTWEDVSKAIAGPVLRNLSHFIVKLRVPVYILHNNYTHTKCSSGS